jgi:hypothetical protein
MPSPAYSKSKGRGAENGVAAYLQLRGYVNAERRRQTGVNDRGDIGGLNTATHRRVVEVKDEKATDLAGWVTELMTEMANDGADEGTVVRKRRGYPYDAKRPETTNNVGEWYAVMPLRLVIDLWCELDELRGRS